MQLFDEALKDGKSRSHWLANGSLLLPYPKKPSMYNSPEPRRVAKDPQKCFRVPDSSRFIRTGLNPNLGTVDGEAGPPPTRIPPEISPQRRGKEPFLVFWRITFVGWNTHQLSSLSFVMSSARWFGSVAFVSGKGSCFLYNLTSGFDQ
ncbi:hypothetical protein CDAR_381631 [Caerostris darwini]|uniref:Uncharacterized protein n=1 Tax=Caerostris darwini TaxID=1538125 RepID=A0AAV4V5L4_9ARAC|nr:hypothetical protein CDAR_381631 [Caerostris darwini]